MLGRFRKTDPQNSVAQRLYEGLVARARAPRFHTEFAGPDSIDGRFDLLALHAFLVMDALKSEGPSGAEISAELASVIFAGFDDALRELGVSDFGIARRIKAMAGAFYGRLEAYRAAQQGGLAAALVRNLYRGEQRFGRESAALAAYMLSAARSLRAEPHT